MAQREAPCRLRVAIFSERPELCRRVGKIMAVQHHVEWIGPARTIEMAVRLCQSRIADVLLVDSRSDPQWKLTLMLTGLFPKSTVVALLAEEARNPVDSAWAVLHGVRGLVSSDADMADLAHIIRTAAKIAESDAPSRPNGGPVTADFSRPP